MRTDWKRSLAVLLGTGVIALTAACGAEVSGAAQGGIPAVAGAGSAEQATTGESSEQVTTSTSEQEPAPSTDGADPTTSPDPTSPDPTSDGDESGGDESGGDESGGANTVVPQPATPQASETTSPGDDTSAPAPAPATTPSSSSGASAKEYAFLKDYCLLMPKAFTTGLEKDTTRKPDLSCTYKAPESSRVYRAATVTGGFSFGDEVLSQSFNVDAAKAKIDGRDGYTWTNTSKSLYSATFNLPDPDGGEMSILVIISDDKSPAELKKAALALATAVSKEVPR